MTKIQPIKANYDHSLLVNSPPFITNNPLIEPKQRAKKELLYAEKEHAEVEYAKYKLKNGFIWAWILGTFGAVAITGKHAHKKIKAALSKAANV